MKFFIVEQNIGEDAIPEPEQYNRCDRNDRQGIDKYEKWQHHIIDEFGPGHRDRNRNSENAGRDKAG